MQSSMINVDLIAGSLESQVGYLLAGATLFNAFGGHLHMSYFGATSTPVLDFW